MAFTNSTTPTITLTEGCVNVSGAADNNASNHAYPRVTDPAYNTPLAITNVNGNDVTINVGVAAPSGLQSSYPRSSSPLTATTGTTYTPGTGILSVRTTANHGLSAGDSIKFLENAVTFSCDAATTAHTWAGGTATNVLTDNNNNQYNVTAADYNPSTGDLTLTVPGSLDNLNNTSTVTIANNGLTFSCAADNNASNHTYPRATDPAYGQALSISAVGTRHTITDVAYDAATGVMGITIGAGHSFSNGDKVLIDDESITLNCDYGSGGNDSYPRTQDPASKTWLTISNVSGNTFEVNVGNAGVAQTNTHTLVSAVANGLTCLLYTSPSPRD